MKTTKFYIFSLFIFFSHLHISAQEKFLFLQNRFDGFVEIINKNYTEEKLTTLKNDFASIGVAFNFSNLTFNQKTEITGVTLKLKNKKSSASLSLEKTNGTIPAIKVGETNGIVSIKLVTKSRIKENLRIGPSKNHPTPLYLLNDNTISSDLFKKINPKEITSLLVLKKKEALLKFGQKGQHGALIITTTKQE